MDLVQEPMWNMSFVVTGVDSPHLRTPTAARSQIRPSLTTTTASAGRSCFLRMTSSDWAVSAGVDGAAVRVRKQAVEADTSRTPKRSLCVIV